METTIKKMRALKLEPAQRNSFQHTYRIGGNQVWGRGLSSKTTQTFLSPFNAFLAFRHPAKSYHTSSLLLITSKKPSRTSSGEVFWRRERDSNPCEIALKRFSRPPRYDHFDIPPNRYWNILSHIPRFVKSKYGFFMLRRYKTAISAE